MDSASLGHFTLVEKIGEGGMGRVYKARDTRLDRLVAIKLLPEARLAGTDRRSRFVQEARAASALNHPNIITIHDIAEQDGQIFIVMELVAGKPLNELIPRKGMRLTEALRIAAQVAGALTTAHAAGIVHRDLKPANIMVDTHGRVKVLDFGLAKLVADGSRAVAADEPTRTMNVGEPHTDEGVILGSVPYMSPEQAEGRPLDARSDIFSFGAVLYEMITGQRAFRGESRASTLAAVVEKDPQPASEIAAGTPPELERVIGRCLRKDVNRRSQNMADVQLALEELRDESESGKLVRPSGAGPAGAPGRRWLWPAVAAAAVLVAAAALGWTYLNRRTGPSSQSTELVRLSPDDGHSYGLPSISPDGKFVAYISDRSGLQQVWLQQVAGGEPIQLTHSKNPVQGAQFFPDGNRLGYATYAAETQSGSVEVIPTLGGQSRILAATRRIIGGAISPDGRQGAYFESRGTNVPVHLMIASTEGGAPRELSTWAQVQPQRDYYPAAIWTADSRYLLCVGSKQPASVSFDDWDWFALPVDGGVPRATGAGDALRAAGLSLTAPAVLAGDSVLFAGGKTDRKNVWAIPFAREGWRVRGAPRQLTFGTENQQPVSISASGTVAMDIFKESADLYLIPASPASGQPTGVSRRLTRDGRLKYRWAAGGHPGSVYFLLGDPAGESFDSVALDLESGKQSILIPGLTRSMRAAVSPDGRQIAYSVAEGASLSVRVGDSGASPSAARPLCKSCGVAERFSADGRFLFLQAEARVKPDLNRKQTVHLLELASGKQTPWLEHPTDSVSVLGSLGEDQAWVDIRVRKVGLQEPGRTYLVPWREAPVPVSEWIEVKLPGSNSNYSPFGNYFQFFQGTKLMAMRFDPKTRTVSAPYEVKYAPGTEVTVKPDDSWGLRGPGIVFSHKETTSSVWLMKLPE